VGSGMIVLFIYRYYIDVPFLINLFYVLIAIALFFFSFETEREYGTDAIWGIVFLVWSLMWQCYIAGNYYASTIALRIDALAMGAIFMATGACFLVYFMEQRILPSRFRPFTVSFLFSNFNTRFNPVRVFCSKLRPDNLSSSLDSLRHR
jgi:hypothetical protein